MAAKKAKQVKNLDEDQKKVPETGSKQPDISDAFFEQFKGAFVKFAEIPETKRSDLYGDKEYLEQFWEYFSKTHPNLLDKIDKKDLPIYIQTLQDLGFSIENITKNTGKLHEEFKDEHTELYVMQNSLSELQQFCQDSKNKIPSSVREDFAKDTGFDKDSCVIDSSGDLQTIDDLRKKWKEYAETKTVAVGGEMVKLADYHTESIQKILNPTYNPIERIMVSVAINKIRNTLKGPLKTAFAAQFPSKVTAFSTCADLMAFKDQWLMFLADHAGEIDTSLAKKLDDIIVTNGDIYNELSNSGRKFDDSKGFSEREHYFRRIFNDLATRQLFEKVQKSQDTIDHYISVIGNTFKEFPPYVNDILNMPEYKFNSNAVSAIDTTFVSDIQHIQDQIVDLNNQLLTAPDEEKKVLKEKIKALRQEMEYRRRQAYIAFLRSKNPGLADVFAQLVASKFDFSTLVLSQQQLLVDVLVKNKLEDSIKNKVPELLDVKEEDITQFINDLFDLNKMDITIPTKHGPVPLSFVKKEFQASGHTHLPKIDDLQDLKNLPLNFITQLTDGNASFFEDSEIFNSIYTDFSARNGNFRFNEGYRVRIKKDGKPVEGYLSSYCPINEKYNDKDYTGKELFLYSHPITSPSDERTLVTRPHEEGETELPVVIKDNEQKLCDMEILDKKLNLNGDGFGALLFGYVLGQQSMNTSLSSQQEEDLAKKFGQLEVYRDKNELEEEKEVDPLTQQKESKEKTSEYTQFMNEWKILNGYSFPEDKENFGFVPGTKLFLPFASSMVPPESVGNAWLQMEIIHIDRTKGTFKVKIHGGELNLGSSEGGVKELPISLASISGIKDAFSTDIYKVPDMKGVSFEDQIARLTSGSIFKDLDNHFGSVKLDGSKFAYTFGNYVGKEVTHFGIYEQKPMGEDVDKETGKMILYKIKPNSNGTITVSGDSTSGNYAKHFPSRDMDYVTFMLFVKDKGLQPKCKEQVQELSQKKADLKQETPTTVHGFSFNNIVGFFKNSVSKVKDSMKKYDDERTEELTDILTSQGQLWGKVGGLLSPFSRISSSFETMGMEQFLERDTRVWNKVNKWMKFYDDFDYTKLYTMFIGPMLSGKIKITPHYKIAAMLLVHLKKGKGPYAKDETMSAKGNRIGLLFGEKHQQRYIDIREKRIRDLEQDAHKYGTHWADQGKNELVELEMRYIVHVMDGRHMGMGDPEKWKQQDKYSKKFCDTLEETYVPFFKQGTVDEGFTKAQDVNFEFARVEYFRQLADRPQQALPYLKVMATKAINDTQWQVFETAVMTGMLSGIFLTMTYSTTQSYIQKICRTRGFIPGIFARDIQQQHKLQKILDIFSNGDFTKKTGDYSPTKFSFRNNEGPRDFISKFVAWNDGKIAITTPDGNKREENVRSALSKFLEVQGPNVDGKNILELYDNPKTPPSDKAVLHEYIEKTNERNEELDSDVQKNTSSLTGSILTKSQSVVAEMIKINQYGFDGKDSDAKQNMEDFSQNMKKVIPGGVVTQTQAKFFVEKFFNRFSVFSGNNKTELLKRLTRCQQHPSSSDVEHIMYYSIVGEIVGSISSRDALLPPELEGALNAWKNFFKNNLNTILSPDVVASSFGNQHKDELLNLSKKENRPELYPWEEASQLLDGQESTIYINTRSSNEEKEQARKKRESLKGSNTKYINGSLYVLAEALSKKCSGFANNRFKMLGENKAPSSKSSAKATGAKINNPEIIDKVRQVLEGKNITDDNSYIPTEDYDEYSY